MAVPSVTDADFAERVLNNPLPVVVDFWAAWCGPCKMIAPIMDELSDAMVGKVDFVKVDADECGELAMQYAVRALPTLMLFVNGEVVDRRTGAGSKANFEQWISQATAG